MAIPAFKKDPGLILPVLEKLRDDDSESVRKSVANNLKDISKDHPGLVLDICEHWYGKSKNTDWIVKHACRNMMKAGDSRAMILFGFGDPGNITVDDLTLDKKKFTVGDKVQFAFTLKVSTKKACKVRLEYSVDFAKVRGGTSRKVFKITENTFTPGDTRVTRRHSFVDMSTRKHHPGKHRIAIIVNGVEKAHASLILTK